MSSSQEPGPGAARETPREVTLDEGRPIGRRVFLGTVGLGITSLLWGQAAIDLLSKSTSALPQGVRSAIPFGQGWRIYAVNPPFPTFDRASWTFTIEGLVEKPITYTYDQLLALPAADQTTDFHCVTGWSVDDVVWKGVRLDDLLAEAKPLASAKGMEFWSMEEEYVDTLTLDQAAMPDVMLAYEMYGQPIPREHGAPTRMVIPKMYGYKGTKWCNRIKLVDRIEDGYWEVRGYDRDAWVGDSNGL
ncbi:MAG: molybdopterin-dependent oxidoreductase [Solirubrobacteraceae bacterium]|nr:molybdopterin-dependent oxidoreductase [Solirubrobacteraceae bacterium]